MKKITGMLLFFLGFQAFGNLTTKVQLEAGLQQKVLAILSPMDPHAQVMVNVLPKAIQADLPGIETRFESNLTTADNNSISGDDIKRVEFRIFTNVHPVPDAVKKLLISSLQNSSFETKFYFEKMDAQVAAAIKSRESSNFFQSEKNASKNKILPENLLTGSESKQVFILLGVGLTLLLSLFGSLMFIRSFVRREFSNLVTALQAVSERSENLPVPSRHLEDVKSSAQPFIAAPASGALEFDRETIQSLSRDSIKALFSDCYWCEEDMYAAWVWTQLSTEQKSLLLSDWSLAKSYVSNLSRPAYKSFHNHPTYLAPVDLSVVSNGEIAKWITKNPQAWHALGPMRQSHLPLTLIEKLNLSQTVKTADIVIPLFQANLDVRKIEQKLVFQEISFSDELEILKNPGVVPSNSRSDIKSLVWLAILEKDARHEILSKISAQQLAQAWVGPEEILNIVRNSLPEKKQKMLQDYLGSVRAQRESLIMQFLVQEALVWDIKEIREQNDKKAA